VQLDLKRAELREAQTHLQQAQRQLSRMERLSKSGAISAEILAKARDDTELSQFQVEQKGILVREAELRLQQAKRRLDNLQAAAEDLAPQPKRPPEGWNSVPKAPSAGNALPRLPASSNPRVPARSIEEGSGLRDLEKKLDMLLKEVEALRQELQRRKSSRDGQNENEADVITINSRKFAIPVRVDEGLKHNLKEVQLLVSTNQGRTWQVVAHRPANATAFEFDASTDGLYWFMVRTIDDQGRHTPEELSPAQAGLKVRVAANPDPSAKR
jgi:hypothetical protein